MTARSKLDVHVHLHGKFADDLPDEVHIHLHADSDAKVEAALKALKDTGPPRPMRMMLGCAIYTPGPDQQTKVRAVDASPGVICCNGFARSIGMAPDRIFARCFHADPGNPGIMPIPADAVEGVVTPASDPNFAFDQNPGSQEIPNVQHGVGAGVRNWIIVWPVYGTTIKDATKRTFFGVTATETECQPSGGYATMEMMVEAAGHRSPKYRVRPENSKCASAALPLTFTVQRNQSESGATEMAWTTAKVERDIIDGILWVTQADDGLQATLALRAAFGTKLQMPLVFRCADWRPSGNNTLAPDPTMPIAKSLPKLIVEPQ